MRLGFLMVGDMFKYQGEVYKATSVTNDGDVRATNQKTKKREVFGLEAEVEPVKEGEADD